MSTPDRGSAARWFAAALALLTVGLWALPETAVSERRGALDAYALQHPFEELPDTCADGLGRDHWVAIRVLSSSAQFDRLCLEVGDAVGQAGLRRWGLRRDGPVAEGLAAPLLFPDLLSLVAGAWLLAMVVGGALEQRRGRRELVLLLVVSAAAPTLAWWALAGPAAQAWLGGAATVCALLSAAAVLLSAEPQRYWVPGAAEPIELPMWSLVGWWWVGRLLSAALFGIERSALTAELLALPMGAALGWALRVDALAAVRGAIAAGKAQLDTAAPAPVGPPLGPEVQAGGAVDVDATGGDDPASDDEADGAAAADPALAALFAEDEPAPPRLAAPGPRPEAVLPAQAAALFARGATKAPAPSVDGAPQLDDLLADLLGAAPASEAPQPQVVSPAPAVPPVEPLAAPARQSGALASVLPPSAAQPSAAQPSVAPFRPARQSGVLPSAPADAEPTQAYVAPRPAGGHSPSGANEAAPLPQVRLAQRLRRGGDGGLQCELDGDWLPVATDLIEGVAVGLIEHRDWPGSQPEIWIDVITQRARRNRAAEVLRLHLSRAALEELAPGVAMAQAFAGLAEELAAGGALCLPQQPLWPGPPWPRYATAADFVAMWQRQLDGSAA